MKRVLWLLALGACGDNSIPPPDAAITCDATLTGNFSEQSSSLANCPQLDGPTFHLDLPLSTFEASLAIDITLGAASAGVYSSRSVGDWRAFALHKIGNQACAYAAGSTAVPEGAFELTLDDLAPVHGVLQLDLAVLTFPNSQCGPGETEHLDLRF